MNNVRASPCRSVCLCARQLTASSHVPFVQMGWSAHRQAPVSPCAATPRPLAASAERLECAQTRPLRAANATLLELAGSTFCTSASSLILWCLTRRQRLRRRPHHPRFRLARRNPNATPPRPIRQPSGWSRISNVRAARKPLRNHVHAPAPALSQSSLLPHCIPLHRRAGVPTNAPQWRIQMQCINAHRRQVLRQQVLRAHRHVLPALVLGLLRHVVAGVSLRASRRELLCPGSRSAATSTAARTAVAAPVTAATAHAARTAAAAAAVAAGARLLEAAVRLGPRSGDPWARTSLRGLLRAGAHFPLLALGPRQPPDLTQTARPSHARRSMGSSVR